MDYKKLSWGYFRIIIGILVLISSVVVGSAFLTNDSIMQAYASLPIDPPVQERWNKPLSNESSVIHVANSAELSNVLLLVKPGDVIEMADGTYIGPFGITKHGNASEPIILRGSRKAIISNNTTSAGSAAIVLKANYWHLEGFTITNSKKGIFLEGASYNVMTDLLVHNIGDEGIRFKLNSSNNILKNSEIKNIGVNVPSNNNNGNGEGIYIGSIQSQWIAMDIPDESNNNQILNNIIGPYVRSEGLSVSEGSKGGLIQGNQFDGHGTLLENSAGGWVDIKGDGYTIIFNTGKYALEPTAKIGGGFEVHYKSSFGKNNIFALNTADLSELESDASYGYYFDKNDKGGNTICSNNKVIGKKLTNVTEDVGGICDSFQPNSTVTPIPTVVTPIVTLTPESAPSVSPLTPSGRVWTVMLYLDGDNNLSSWLRDATLRLGVLPNDPRIEIVVLLDKNGKSDTRRWVVKNNNTNIDGVNSWDLGEQNMGDPNTLANFIQWSTDNYPAQHYYLVIADHGHALQGVAWDKDDKNNDDRLTPADLKTALKQATKNGKFKLDIIQFDTCLMGTVEIAYQIKDYANYMIASQNLGWGIFAYEPYIRLIYTSKFTINSRDLAIGIANTYFNTDIIKNQARTISVFDLTKVEDLALKLNSLSQLLRSNIGNITNSVTGSRNSSQKYTSRSPYTAINNDDVFIDLYSYVERLKSTSTLPAIQQAAENVLTSISSGLIISDRHLNGWGNQKLECWDLSGSHGASIYFPARSGGYGYDDYIKGVTFDFAVTSKWKDFLIDYFSVAGLAPDSDEDLGIPPFEPVALTNESNNFIVYFPMLFNTNRVATNPTPAATMFPPKISNCK